MGSNLLGANRNVIRCLPDSMLCPALSSMRGPHLPLWPFLASVTRQAHLFLLHYCSVAGLEENVEIGYPYSNRDSIHPSPPVPMHLPSFLAHTSAISLGRPKAKVQSLRPQAEVVPVSADDSVSLSWVSPTHIFLPIKVGSYLFSKVF